MAGSQYEKIQGSKRWTRTYAEGSTCVTYEAGSWDAEKTLVCLDMLALNLNGPRSLTWAQGYDK